MTISEIIAKNARAICRRRKIPIHELEQKIGVSQGYLSRIKGKSTLSIDAGYAIADQLGVSMEYLMSEDIARKLRIAELKKELALLEQEVDS